VRLAILTSHPIQYYAPLFHAIACRNDVKVYFAHQVTPQQQAADGFDTEFEWDIDLLDGYPNAFLRNAAEDPGVHHFAGCDTPDIGAELAGGRFDALLTMGWHLKCYWQGLWAAKRLGIPVMVRGDSHLDTPRSLSKRIIKRATYPVWLRLFDAALFVGRRNRAYYEHYRYPGDRLFHSPHCIDTERFSTVATPDLRSATRKHLGIEPEDKAVLFAGKLVPSKRPVDVIEAAALLRREGMRAHVVVAGSGPLEEHMRVRAEALDVPLNLLGFQNQSSMPAAYAAADVLALPSTGETWGLVCNEALACGTPIVVSDKVGCAPDLAADAEVGCVFPVGDVSSLTNALGEILTAPPSVDAIRRVSDSHSLQSAAAGVVAAFKMVASPVPGR